MWSPVVAALALVAPGALALATHQIFLFASLGPTAVTIGHQPQHPSSRPYNVLVGHAVGLFAAFGAVALLGLRTAPSVFMVHQVGTARVVASVLALGVSTAVEIRLHAQHPPAASTTLLAALGSFHPTWHDTGLVLGGVIAVTIAAELLKRVRQALSGDSTPERRNAEGEK